MSRKAKLKIVVDVAMTLLFLMQMGYHMMNNCAHESTGVALCLLIIVHHALNGGWHASLFLGRYTPRHWLLTAVDVLLTFAMIAVILSAVMFSRHVFDFPGLKMRFLGRTIHMPSTMWAFVLTGLHLGLHWSLFLGMMKRACQGRAANAAVLAGRVVLAAVFAFGAYQFVARGLWMELFMLREFAFLDYGEPLAFFFASYAAILAAWAAVTHYLNKAIKVIEGHTKQAVQRRANA